MCTIDNLLYGIVVYSDIWSNVRFDSEKIATTFLIRLSKSVKRKHKLMITQQLYRLNQIIEEFVIIQQIVISAVVFAV